MTERDYINVSNLQRLRIVEDILRKSASSNAVAAEAYYTISRETERLQMLVLKEPASK